MKGGLECGRCTLPIGLHENNKCGNVVEHTSEHVFYN